MMHYVHVNSMMVQTANPAHTPVQGRENTMVSAGHAGMSIIYYKPREAFAGFNLLGGE